MIYSAGTISHVRLCPMQVTQYVSQRCFSSLPFSPSWDALRDLLRRPSAIRCSTCQRQPQLLEATVTAIPTPAESQVPVATSPPVYTPTPAPTSTVEPTATPTLELVVTAAPTLGLIVTATPVPIPTPTSTLQPNDAIASLRWVEGELGPSESALVELLEAASATSQSYFRALMDTPWIKNNQGSSYSVEALSTLNQLATVDEKAALQTRIELELADVLDYSDVAAIDFALSLVTLDSGGLDRLLVHTTVEERRSRRCGRVSACPLPGHAIPGSCVGPKGAVVGQGWIPIRGRDVRLGVGQAG